MATTTEIVFYSVITAIFGVFVLYMGYVLFRNTRRQGVGDILDSGADLTEDQRAMLHEYCASHRSSSRKSRNML